MPKFTVFTPTYNRGYILEKLYQSLENQTNKDFEWLIVDDGSTDNTETQVKAWQTKDNGFAIRYEKKENGGKPRAINYGIKLAKGKYFFMVDSDDRLCCDAIEKMEQWCAEIDNNDTYIGVGAARGYPDGTYLKGVSPKVGSRGYVDATNLQRADYDLDADMCEAYKTNVFQQFPMAEYRGEKFAPEQIALNEIALHGYKLRWHSDIIYICDYLEDGLTKGSSKLEAQNPIGYAMMYNHQLKYPNKTTKEKLYAAIQFCALLFTGNQASMLKQTNSWLYTIPAIPIGFLLSFRRKKQYKRILEQ